MNETKSFFGFIFTEHSEEELMEPWGYTVAAIVLFFIGFFGFFLNLFVIILMCRDLQVSLNGNVNCFCKNSLFFVTLRIKSINILKHKLNLFCFSS